MALSLTPEQDAQVRRLASSGVHVGGIQKVLREDMGLSPTFLEVRLYLIENGIEISEAPAQDAKKEEPAKGGGAEAAKPPAGEGAQAPGGVSVTADKVVPPGTIAAGEAVFSDGETGRWYLDNYGQLGFESFSKPGYRPSQDDMAAFKTRLVALLQSKGLM